MTTAHGPMPAGAIDARLHAAGLPPLPRATWLEVDLGILAANAARLFALVPEGTELGLVVKADGYGHGMVAAARAALRGGASLLIVATLDEATGLRDAGIDAPVLVLYPVPPWAVGAAYAAGIEIVVADEASLDAAVAGVAAHQAAAGRPAGWAAAPRVHLGIDTGMSRGGLAPDRAVPAARRLLDAGLPGLAGTWSHLATPEDPAAVNAQVARFESALDALRGTGIDPGIRHLNATGGLIAGSPPYDLVRVGLAFYGVLPPEVGVAPALAADVAELRPAASLRARAATIATVPAGTAVGYGGTWTASRRSVIATVPLGYADGWTRAYAANSWGVVRGQRVPLIGRVSSDALAIDVTGIPAFGPADEIVLLGDVPPAMTVHDLAALRGSIAWEVLDAFTPRISRVYVDDGRIVGTRYLDGVTRFAGAWAD